MPSLCSAEDPAQGFVEAGQAFYQLSYISALHEVLPKNEARDREMLPSLLPHTPSSAR